MSLQPSSLSHKGNTDGITINGMGSDDLEKMSWTWRVGKGFYKSVGAALYVISQKIKPFVPNLLSSNGATLQGYSEQIGLLAQTSEEQDK